MTKFTYHRCDTNSKYQKICNDLGDGCHLGINITLEPAYSINCSRTLVESGVWKKYESAEVCCCIGDYCHYRLHPGIPSMTLKGQQFSDSKVLGLFHDKQFCTTPKWYLKAFAKCQFVSKPFHLLLTTWKLITHGLLQHHQ